VETKDMYTVRRVSKYATEISVAKGGSGNPLSVTVYGDYTDMKVAAKFQFGTGNLEGKKVLVQGIGHIGEFLVQHLSENAAIVAIVDINEQKLKEISSK